MSDEPNPKGVDIMVRFLACIDQMRDLAETDPQTVLDLRDEMRRLLKTKFFILSVIVGMAGSDKSPTSANDGNPGAAVSLEEPF